LLVLLLLLLLEVEVVVVVVVVPWLPLSSLLDREATGEGRERVYLSFSFSLPRSCGARSGFISSLRATRRWIPSEVALLRVGATV
jgi:hypothetical protein